MHASVHPAIQTEQMLQHRRLPLSPDNPVPYYLTLTDARFKLERCLLPQLWRILAAPAQPTTGNTPAISLPRKRSRLWRLEKNPQDAVRYILDSIGELLQEGANTAPIGPPGSAEETCELPGHASFANPKANENLEAECMLIDADKIKAMTGTRKRYPHFFWGLNGYARIKLATLGDGKSDIIEGVHRFVLWAMHGPPDTGICHPVCMHTCHRPNCVQPRHMRYGSNKENLMDRSPAVV